MITKQQYVEYLISTIGNYTGTHLAEHLDQVSHDTITDYLQSEHLTARSLWELVGRLIADSPEAFLIVDDSVQDKRYPRFIELVKLQWSRSWARSWDWDRQPGSQCRSWARLLPNRLSDLRSRSRRKDQERSFCGHA
jgi:hypothetical protein